MNVSLPAKKIILSILLCFALGAFLHAQGTTYEEDTRVVYKNGSTVYQMYVTFSATLLDYPRTNHGQVQWIDDSDATAGPDPNSSVTLRYTPDQDYVGYDTVRVAYMNNPPSQIIRTIVIEVVESQVFAKDDYITTANDESVTISVLDNDTGDRGDLALEANFDLSSNFGTAELLENGQISFDPQGQSGIAHINYLVCDGLGSCDLGKITVCAYDEGAAESDTLRIITTKDTPQPILLPVHDFNIEQAPGNGGLSYDSGFWTYAPEAEFTGFDTFIFSKDLGGEMVYKTVFVEVIEVPVGNIYLKDDFTSTPLNNAIEIDYLRNDRERNQLVSPAIEQQPMYGTLEINDRGVVTYIPPRGFSGIDQFTYSAYPPFAIGDKETATVYVNVSDYNPSATVFSLTTPKNMPIIIQYNIPIPFDRFEVVNQGDKGEISFHQEYAGIINGEYVERQKVLLYTPHADATGMDEFELKYCVSGTTENCPSIKVEMEIEDVAVPEDHTCVAESCVWAGDTNRDGVVNVKDLLPIGLFMGEQGKNRPDPNLEEWYGQYGEDWEAVFNRFETDLKHTDTDGNGIVTTLDTMAVSKFYGRTHTITPTPAPEVDPLPIYFGVPDTVQVVGLGTRIEIPIHLGDEYYKAFDIYGLTIDRISYNPNLVEEGSVRLEFTDSWLSYNSPTISMVKEPVEGRLEAAFTRTNGIARSGHGVVGKLSFVVIDDIIGIRLGKDPRLNLSISASASNSAGQVFALPGDDAAFALDLSQPDEEQLQQPVSADQLQVFPNPTSDFMNLHLNGYQDIEQIEVYDLTGRRVYEAQTIFSRRTQIDVAQWSTGIYILKAYTTGGDVVTKKVEVLQ